MTEPDAAPPPHHGDWQYGIYLRGLAGEAPEHPTALVELERRAAEALEPEPRGYVWGGAGTGDTMRANLDAFRRHRLVPRMLRDISQRSLATTVLGTELPAPVLLAPVGVQTIVHPDGELASARGAAQVGVPVVASTAADRSLEQIAEASGDTPRWFQLYWPRDDAITESLVRRAEAAGYSALVVTLDTIELAWRPVDLGHGYLPFLQGTGIAQFTSDPAFRAALEKPPEEDLPAAVGHWAQVINRVVTWDDLAELRSMTKLPILLKGILHPDDARKAQRRGIDGVIVSNHGGRQVDGAIAALDALPGVAEAVGDDMTVLFDSGIRSGADVVKALALGADAVLLGRPYLWGLALDGAAGVETVLRMLLAELDLTLALCGYARPAEVDREAVVEADAQ
jgi:isopentenyl diphosphate isomerase/L-lactate dehydrogenase-like FMN-dependent dehydrogenase